MVAAPRPGSRSEPAARGQPPALGLVRAPGLLPALEQLPARGPGAPRVDSPVLVDARIDRHDPLGGGHWRLALAAPAVAERVQPGQFVMLTVAPPGEPAPVLPRPMAVYDADPAEGTIEVVYRVVGEGTRRLTVRRPGERLTTVGPLGRGFVLPSRARRILLLGRGIGTCSLTLLARRAAAAGVAVAAVASAREPDALAGRAVYERARCDPLLEVVDTDGSSDIERLRGRLADAAAAGLDAVYTCGSARLLELAVEIGAAAGAEVQVSLEAHMACGLGFCHGCASGHAGLADESPLVCADGPVFRWAGARTGRAG